MAIKEMMYYVIGLIWEVGGVFLFMSITMLAVAVGWSFPLWSKLYLKGWSFRSSFFICVAYRGVSLHLNTHSVPYRMRATRYSDLTTRLGMMKLKVFNIIEI